jgi:VCBS repeat-containing protein
VRNLTAAQSTRYAYDLTGRLNLVSAPTGGESVSYNNGVAQRHALTADLGAALGYVGASRNGSLASGAGDYYVFSVRQSEIDATAGGAVLLGVVMGATSGDLTPVLPQLAGLQPIFTRAQGNQSYALFRIDHAGLQLLQLAGAGSGTYSMRIFVAGDANGDQRVDGRDADVLAAARAGAYNASADFDLDGDVDASDSQLLYANLGYVPNQAPTAGTTTLKTHVDLEIERSVAALLADPENDRISLRIAGATHGIARITGDGRTLDFRPETGFTGAATVTLIADDGYTSSGPATITINISNAKLVSIDFDQRGLKLLGGDQIQLSLIGDFEDEQDVALPASYVALTSSDANVATIATSGLLTAKADGASVVAAHRGAITAATAVGVGVPDSAGALRAYYFGIDAYPDSISLTPGTARQMVVQNGEGSFISAAASGTRYFIGDSDLATIDADGKLVARATGDTVVTVIYESAEQLVPLHVVVPVRGDTNQVATVGKKGGIVEGDGGQLISFGEGQLANDVQVAVTTLAAADLGAPLPEAMDFSAAFRINIVNPAVANPSLAVPVTNGPIQIAVPVNANIPAGEKVYFFLEVETDQVDGVLRKYWMPVDSGIVGADGYARSTSPPWPGLSQNGNILMARANKPVRGITIDLQNMFNPALLFIGSTSLIGLLYYLKTITFPIVEQAKVLNAFSHYAGQEVHFDIPVDAGQTDKRILATVPNPPKVDSPAPQVSDVDTSVLASAGLLVINGTGFMSSSGLITDTKVVFRQGGREIEAAALNTSTAKKLIVQVPNTVVLGLAEVFVRRPEVTPAVGANGTPSTVTDNSDSQIFYVKNQGGYGFVGGSGPIAGGGFGVGVQVLDLQRKGDILGDDEKVIKIINLQRTVTTTVATPDLARVFAAVQAENGKSGAVVVIDGLTLDPMDAKPSTPELDNIELPYGQSPTAMALDPNGNYLYVAGKGAVFVIDINPGSQTLHKLVDIITIGSEFSITGRINDMAVNADGTRLYLTAPATELFGGTLAWTRGGRDNGQVLVINVDEADKPVKSVEQPNPPNLRKYHKVIAELNGGLEPYGIKATSDPDKMIFTSRLRGDGFGGLQTIVVTNNDALSFSAKVSTISLQLSNNNQQKYQLYIRNPVDVAITPDLNFAFVLDWNVPLSVGANQPNILIEYMDTHETGSKVGVIEDPFGLKGTPRILAATTPIPLAFATEIVMSSDGRKLYATYKGPGDVLVFDVEALRDKATNPSSRDTYTQKPIDLLHPAVTLPGISVSRSLRGLSVQPYDPLTLLEPKGALQVGDDAEAIVFRWDVDLAALGTNNYTVQVFVSALQPGQGLWPDDPPRDRDTTSRFAFESNPPVRPDNNPNRIWTSDILNKGEKQIALPPEIAKLLIAGQTYYWGVRLLGNGEEFSEASSFIGKPVNTGGDYNIVTVLTHGFQLDPTEGLADPAYQQPAAFLDLARIIVNAAGGGVVLLYNKNTGQWVDPITKKIGAEALQDHKAVVLVSDWYKESDISDSGFSEAAADALYASLADLNNKTNGKLFNSPLHFIGHSRGTVVNSEIVQRLGVLNKDDAKNIQMTTLDPHDQNQPSLNVPVATLLGNISKAATLAEAASLVLPGAQISFVTINRIKFVIDEFLKWAERFGVALDIPYGDFLDPDVKHWSNISFLDNYYQDLATGNIDIGAGGTDLAFTVASVTATPNGVPVTGANLQVRLNDRAGFTQDDFKIGSPFQGLPGLTFSFSFGFGGPHSRLWQWYAGTTDTDILSFSDNPIFRSVADQGVVARAVGLPTFQFNAVPWYKAPGGKNEGIANGWFYSAVGGGVKQRPALPAVAPNAASPVIDPNEDNTEVTQGAEAVPSVFNGNFENGLRQSLYRRLGGSGDKYRFPFSYELPGWSFHGGQGFTLNLGLADKVDLTGLFVIETNPKDLVNIVINKVFDKIWDATVGVLINKAKADTFGVPEAPGPGSSDGYKEWYNNTWSKDANNAAKVTLSDKLFDTFDSSITSLIDSLITLGNQIDPSLPKVSDVFKIQGGAEPVNFVGIAALKTFLQKNIEVLLTNVLGANSNYALLMGGGQILRTLVDAMFLGQTPQVISKALNSIVNLDSITHNRLLVPTDQPILSFNIFAPLIASPNAKVQVIFHPTALDPNLKDETLGPVQLQPSFMQRINYAFAVPESFKGKVADIEFKITNVDVADNNLSLYDTVKDVVAAATGVETFNQLVSSFFFMDDVRFSKGLDAKLSGPINEGGNARLDVTFVPADPTKPVEITVNWNDGANSTETFPVLPAGTTSWASIHRYRDDGVSGTLSDKYAVVVSATNVVGNSTATLQQTVNNVAPVVGPLTVDLPSGGLFEDGEVTVSGTFTDPGLAKDTYRIEVVWGDGSAITTVQAGDIVLPTAAAPAGRFTATHRYKDDNPTATPKDFNSITVVITDDDVGQGTASKTIEIANKPPHIDTLGFVEQKITEGGKAVLKGTFTDEGLQDTHKVKVTWKGGQADLPVTNFANGVGSFEGTITIVDDNPTETDGDDMEFTVKVTDDDTGTATGTATMRVENAKPEVTMKLVKSEIDEGETAVVTVEWSDAGKKDTFKLKLKWSDGVEQTDTAAAGTTSKTFKRTFLDDDPTATASDKLTLTVTVTDDDGAEGSPTTKTELTVKNVAPNDVKIEGPGWGDAGVTAFALSGLWSDPGESDTHEFSWVVKDALGVEVFTSTDEIPGTFTLNSGGTYAVTLKVTDDDTSIGTAMMSINVSELPIVKWEITDPVPTEKKKQDEQVPPDATTFKEGDAVSLFFQGDPTAAQGTYTVSVEWGDGTTSSAVPVTPGTGRTVTHSYRDDQPGAAIDYYDAKVTFGYAFNSITGQTGGTSFVRFYVDNAAPAVDISVTPPAAGGGGAFTFRAIVNDPGALDTHTYTWNFGDGTVLTGAGPTVTHSFIGAHTVTLTVEDDDGGIGSKSVFINPQNASGFGVSTISAVAAVEPPTAAALDALAAQARSAWAAAGADVSLLAGVRVVVADLGRDLLGSTFIDAGQQITIYVDDDGAGRGWYIDSTPAFNEEYLRDGGSARYWAQGGIAARRMDLLTLLEHEYGHVLGLAHVNGGAISVLNESLNIGERRIAMASDLIRGAHSGALQPDSGLLASGVTDGAFNNPAAWATRGAVVISNGQASLSENAAANASLSQDLRIPQGARFLTFELTNVQFGAGGAGAGDAFEMALVDLNSGASLLGPIGLSNTDATINIQRDGAIHAAAGVTFNGLVTTTLPSSTGGPIQVRIDVSRIAAAQPARLSFDLLGFGALASQVSVDNVIFVTAANVVPVAVNDLYTLPRDTARVLDLLLNDSDANDDPFSIDAVTPPLHGTLTLNADGTVSYLPDAGYVGSDRFFYRLSDGQANSALAQVDISVQASNTAPVAQADSVVTSRNQALTIAVLSNDTDADSNLLTTQIVAGPAHGTVSVNNNGSVVYAPALNYFGADTFSYRAYDGALFSNIVDVAITVNAVNNAPVANDDTVVTNEDTPLTFDVRLNDSDVESGALTALVVTTPQHGRVVARSNGTFEYRPDANFNGADRFTYRVNDGELNSGVATVSITVRPVNDAPTAGAVTLAAVAEDSGARLITQAELLAGASDIDGPALSATHLTLSAGNGTLATNGNGTWTYTPALNDDTAASFTYTVSDGSLSASGTATLDITPVNDAPTTAPVSLTAIAEDSGARVITQAELLASANDIDSVGLSATGLAINSGRGTLVNNNDGTWTYTPAPNDDSAAAFSYTVTDGNLAASGSAALDITPVNDAPTTASGTLTAVFEDSGAHLITQAELLASANDIDSVGLSATGLAINSGRGTLVNNNNGSWTYTPALNDDTSASFTYIVTDGRLAAAGSATLDITPVNDAPVIAQQDVIVNESQTLSLDITANDVDAGDTLLYSLDIAPTGATLTPAGHLTWIAADGPSVAGFTVRVTDRAGATAVRSFNAQVANLPPQVAAAGAVSVTIGESFVLTLGYSDPGADTVSTWFIDWGDGSTSTAPGNVTTASHVYANAGRVSIVVRAQDDDGQWAAIPLPLRVLPATLPNPEPTPVTVVEPATVPLTAVAPVTPLVFAPTLQTVSVQQLQSVFNGPLEEGRAQAPVLSVALVDQSAHLFAQEIGNVVDETEAQARGAFLPVAIGDVNGLLEREPPAAGKAVTLQVREIDVMGGGLRVRFNQEFDARALVADGGQETRLLVMRDNVRIKGSIMIHEDRHGFTFVVENGHWQDGAYTVRLLSGPKGFANPRGDALDGDKDGKAGGDYRGRFNLQGGALRRALNDVNTGEHRAAALPFEAPLALSSDMDLSQCWSAAVDAPEGTEGSSGWAALTGGIGGVAILAATAHGSDKAMLRRALAASRRLRDNERDAPFVRIAKPSPAANTLLTRTAQPWISRWFGQRKSEQNDWRIRL